MKILKVILLLLLICKSSIGFSISIDLNFATNSCHSVAQAEDNSANEEEKKHNCCGTSCDCICCAHVFTFEKTTPLKFFRNELVIAPEMEYNFNYNHSFINGVWQPPRLSKNLS